jgi:hypothetical protein
VLTSGWLPEVDFTLETGAENEDEEETGCCEEENEEVLVPNPIVV